MAFHIRNTEGCGGFLCPPNHPTHTHCIEEGPRKNPTGIYSLESNYDYFPETIKNEQRKLLEDWESSKPSLDSPETQDWIHRVLGYFRHCYRGPQKDETCWHAGNLHILPDDNNEPVENHAGVHLIRKYYPEYEPTPDDFQSAYWGTKPNHHDPETQDAQG